MENYSKIRSKIEPYTGILCFLVVLFSTHLLWKLVVDGDIYSQHIAIFGKDFTNEFYRLSQWTAKMIYWTASLFAGDRELHLNDTLIYFSNPKITLSIIWGCTGVKQLYAFVTVMAFCPGPWKKKLWYIPLGGVILGIYNILRIVLILFLTKDHPERFEFLHEHVFRYIYYGIIFLLWVYWEEKIRNRNHQNEK